MISTDCNDSSPTLEEWQEYASKLAKRVTKLLSSAELAEDVARNEHYIDLAFIQIVSDLTECQADVSAAVLTAKPVVQVPVRRVKNSHCSLRQWSIKSLSFSSVLLFSFVLLFVTPFASV